MGCSSSNQPITEHKNFKVSNIPSSVDNSAKSLFLERINSVNELCNTNKLFHEEFLEFCGYDHDQFEDNYENFFEKNRNIINQKIFDKDSFKDTIQSISSKQYIYNSFRFQEYLVIDFIINFAKNESEREITESEFSAFDSILRSTVNEKFPNSQNGLVYFPKSIKSYNFAFGHINNNLIYNHPEFEVKVFNFIIFGDIIDNIGFLKGIAEIIESNQNLCTVVFQLFENYDDKPFEKESLNNLSIIFDAIKNNKNISAVLISLTKGAEYINLGNLVGNKIVDMIENSNISLIYFYRIHFSPEISKRLSSGISKSLKLKMLGIYSSDNNISFLDDLFLGISRNSSLLAVILQKIAINEIKLNELRSLSNQCRTLKLFKYLKMDSA